MINNIVAKYFKQSRCTGCGKYFKHDDHSAYVHSLGSPDGAPMEFCKECADILDQMAALVGKVDDDKTSS